MGTKGLQKYNKLPPEKKQVYIGVKFIANIMPWIERYYHAHKMFPPDSVIMQNFRISQAKMDALNRNQLYKDACEERGLVKRAGNLNAQQIAAVALMTNTMDTRSIEVKLNSIGVTPEMYQGWLSNPTFKQELFVRSEEILENLSPVAHASLAKEVQKGNVSALKMYYEMTGQAQSPETLNAKRLVQTVLEALQKHVKDPVALTNISREILGEAPELAKTQITVTEEVGETLEHGDPELGIS